MSDNQTKTSEQLQALPKPAATPMPQLQEKDPEAVIAKGTIIPGEPEYELDPLLTRILRTRRRHGSQGDMNFRMWLFSYIKTQLKLSPVVKEQGCVYVTTDPKSTVLFSSHVDTVHSKVESDNGDHSLAFDPVFGHLFLADKSKSSCLGGDDGVGVYLMLKMLENKVPGHYVFHTGEEVGGIGSTAFVAANKKLIDEVEAVVAFDRKCIDGEDNEVIITQGGAACASESFGAALAKELSDPKWGFNNKWITSHKGSFTDSKNYAGLAPECVNLGCFYDRQHTNSETVNVYELDKLVKAVVGVQWKMLPIIRKPSVFVVQSRKQQAFGYEYGYGMYEGMYEDMADDFQQKPKQASPFKSQPPSKKAAQKREEVDLQGELDLLDTYRMADIEELVEMMDSGETVKFLALAAIEIRKLRAETEMLRTLLELDV